jgi:DNA polymerase III subunit chi
MPQVDFYILPDTALEQRALFACRLIEKIYKLGHRVYVQHQDRAQAQALDNLLWEFQAASFIPHQLADAHAANAAPQNSEILSSTDKMSPVWIGWHGCADRDFAAANDSVLINLADAVPDFFNSFQRISEIVVQTPEVLASTRSAWRYYQQSGCALERHDLRSAQR